MRITGPALGGELLSIYRGGLADTTHTDAERSPFTAQRYYASIQMIDTRKLGYFNCSNKDRINLPA